MKSGGFLAGALAGLAVALLVVGAASVLPQTNSPLETASLRASAQSVTAKVEMSASATSSTTNGSAQFASTPPVAQIAGAAGPAASSSTTTAPQAGASAVSNLSGANNTVKSGLTASAGTRAQQEPGSLLAVLPGESFGRVVATVSPLLVGLLLAALVYGAYARRQDTAS